MKTKRFKGPSSKPRTAPRIVFLETLSEDGDVGTVAVVRIERSVPSTAYPFPS
jgi:hypothetical protein